jgi:hypothetical protein
MDNNSRYTDVRPGVLWILTAGIWALDQVFYV